MAWHKNIFQQLKGKSEPVSLTVGNNKVWKTLVLYPEEDSKNNKENHVNPTMAECPNCPYRYLLSTATHWPQH